jgi:predicted phosphate transport protein (TIGR00153 family)
MAQTTKESPRMFRLIPKEVQFFDLFERSAQLLVEGAQVLQEALSDVEKLPEKAHRLERLEHDADQVTHEIMAKLNRTFITPLDREDIHQLAAALDDVMDFIEAVTEHLVLYKVQKVTPHFQALAQVVQKQVREIYGMVVRLRQLRHADILQHCIEVNRLENEGDRIHRQALAELFDHGGDPLEVLKWRDLYGLLETATDKCEDVAIAIEGIFLKNA